MWDMRGQITHAGRPASGDEGDHPGGVWVKKRPHPGQKSVEGHSNAVGVRATVRVSVSERLGRLNKKVAGRRSTTCGVHLSRQPEIPEQGRIPSLQEDVRWLDVTVQNAGVVTPPKTDEDTSDPATGDTRYKAARRSAELVLRRPLEGKLHRDVRNVASLVGICIQHRQDVGRAERLEELGFLVSERPADVSWQGAWVEQLEGNALVEVLVIRFPDLAKASLPERRRSLEYVPIVDDNCHEPQCRVPP